MIVQLVCCVDFSKKTIRINKNFVKEKINPSELYIYKINDTLDSSNLNWNNLWNPLLRFNDYELIKVFCQEEDIISVSKRLYEMYDTILIELINIKLEEEKKELKKEKENLEKELEKQRQQKIKEFDLKAKELKNKYLKLNNLIEIKTKE